MTNRVNSHRMKRTSRVRQHPGSSDQNACLERRQRIMAIQQIIISGEVIKVFPLGTCACGCGKELVLADSRGRPRRFLVGHGGRGKTGGNPNYPGLHQDVRFCYCGKQLDKWRNKFCTRKCQEEYSKANLQIKRVCKYCKKEFIIRKATLKTNATGNYCSRGCYADHLKTLKGEKSNRYNRIVRNCDFCGKEIKVIPYRIAHYPNHFCSRKCKHAFHKGRYVGENNPCYNRIDYSCDNCGKVFKIIPARLKKQCNHYCSRTCQMNQYRQNNSGVLNRNWKGGGKHYKNGFPGAKAKYFNKKNSWCAICGTFKKIHIHHIIPYRLTKDNTPSNLIPLCDSCHRKTENATCQMIDGNFDKDLALAKTLLNISLRGRQVVTYHVLLEIKEKIIAERISA